jgi:hypothetical protein
MALFDSSWAGQKIEVERVAVAAVRNLDRETISDPGLASILDKIVNYHTLQVAVFQPGLIKGKRRGVARVISEFGESRNVTIQVMDVTIPFQGDADSFRLSPSYCTIPSLRCDIEDDHLLVTMADDANVQRNVDQFVQQVTQNLEALRSEVANWVPQIRATLDQVASARMKEIASQDERDKGLKFKVD